MKKSKITTMHMNATPDDLAGNNGIGRYILLPGSHGRAKEIAQHFNELHVKEHPRGHSLYLGTITHKNKKIDVATVSSGMGCPSMEIILHELFELGAKRYLRVGTAGSLQSYIHLGDIINVEASVRDEATTLCYAPLGVPATASFEFISAIMHAADNLQLTNNIHTGNVHCKSSFYAREFGIGPKADENNTYMRLLTECGILATEMETSTLCIQTQIYNQMLMKQGDGAMYRALCGALLGIIVIPPHELASTKLQQSLVNSLTLLALETIRYLSDHEN